MAAFLRLNVAIDRVTFINTNIVLVVVVVTLIHAHETKWLSFLKTKYHFCHTTSDVKVLKGNNPYGTAVAVCDYV